MRDRFDTLQQRVSSDLEEQLRESEKRQAKELCDMQALSQERLDRLEEQLRESEKRQAKELCDDIQALHQEETRWAHEPNWNPPEGREGMCWC